MTMDEFTQGLAGMDPFELALGAGFVGIIFSFILFGGLIWYFVSALGYRKMFIKAGEAGWKAFVPYYKSFICFRFAWNTKYFLLFLLTLLVVQFVPTPEKLLPSLIMLADCIVFVVLTVKLNIRVARSFGKSTIWGVLLIFFPFIISLILGYGKAEYIGNTTLPKDTC